MQLAQLVETARRLVLPHMAEQVVDQVLLPRVQHMETVAPEDRVEEELLPVTSVMPQL
jgi:hypothetical protein